MFRAIFVLVVSCLARGQAADAPVAFEVAAIKPSDPARPIAIKRSGNRLETVSTSLEMLITWAYDIHTDRLYGKPGWLDSVRYDIAANAPEGSIGGPREPGQPTALQRMMQALLAERFHLALHREIRPLPMYALVVAKGGAKVHLTDFSGSMGQNPFRMPGRGRLIGTQVSTEMLTKVLAEQVGLSVQDETGLKGVFDFALEWEPETTEASGGVRVGPSLFTALQEQLGFRLEPRKGNVEVLAIDHIERTPTEN